DDRDRLAERDRLDVPNRLQRLLDPLLETRCREVPVREHLRDLGRVLPRTMHGERVADLQVIEDDGQAGRVVSVRVAGEDGVDLVRLVAADYMVDDRFSRFLVPPVFKYEALIVPRPCDVSLMDRERV